jgi:hypothetical protein
MAGREAMMTVNELVTGHGNRWPGEWLRRRGLDEAAEAWSRMA